MKEMLLSLQNASREAIDAAADMDALEALRVRYLGKKVRDNKNTYKQRWKRGKKARHMRQLRAKLRKGEKIKVCLSFSRICRATS